MWGKGLPLRQVAVFGVLGAVTFALKLGMAFLPNIEPVSLLILLFAVTFGWKALYIVGVYVVLEILCFGLGLWNINYLYIWAILAVIALVFRKIRSPLAWAVISGVFGLFFGALCGIVDLFIGGWGYALTKWISGIPFDLLHCGGNFVMALLLFDPLRRLLTKLCARIGLWKTLR